ncbi:MAG TPA: DUF748 domain-containing protein, partial [Woeseiaceae bacterium]|nr:DUF748 domain-containing protein [Woeseiaceae bacterium]
ILWTMLTVLLAGIVLYTLAGFALAPQLVKRWIEAVVTADSGRRLEAEAVAFNPYTFEMSFTNLTLYDRENKAAFSVRQLDAVLDPRSLSRQQPIFSGTVELTGIETSPATAGEFYLAVNRLTADGAALHPGRATVETMRIDRPEMRLVRNGNGELNLPPLLKQLVANTSASWLGFAAIEVNEGRVQFYDNAVSPATHFEAEPVTARIEATGGDRAGSTEATVQGRLAAPAGGEVEVEWRRNHGSREAGFAIKAGGVALPALSPYTPGIVGRALVGGRLDLDFDMKRAGGRTAANLRLATEDLELAPPTADQAAGLPPVDLAVALLEDRVGILRIERAVEQPSVGTGIEPGRKLSLMLSTALNYTARNPFEVLGDIAGASPSALRQLDFLPGSAELVAPSMQSLDALARALESRPRLALVMHPAYDPVADRDALSRQQVRLHVVLATSARPPGQADDAQLDFSDEKVRGVLDEFTSTRLPQSARSAIAAEHPERSDAYYRAAFDALVANQDVDDAALRRLARYRVQSAIGELIRLGVDAGRLIRYDGIDVRTGGTHTVSVDIVPVPADAQHDEA